jgi:hypothetical protein
MKILQLIAYIFILAVLMPPQSAQARPSYQEKAAEIRRLRDNIAADQREINAAADNVLKAIAAIHNAERLWGPHWITLEQAVQQWVDTTSNNIGLIDLNARSILRLDPAANIHLEALTNPGLAFRALRDQLIQIRTGLASSVTRAQQARQRQEMLRVQVVGEMREGVYLFPVEVIADQLGVPTKVEDVDRSIAESVGFGVITVASILKGWFIIPVVADLADRGFKLVVKTYYFADEMKSGTRVLKSTEEVLAFADEFISRQQARIRAVDQAIDLTERLWQQAGDTLANFQRAQNGWQAVIREAAKERAEQELRRFDEAQAKPEPGVGLWGIWPNVPQSTLPASEFEPEAEAILRELRSAAEAAIHDGGSPLIFFELADSHHQQLADRRAGAEEQVRQASVVQGQAMSGYKRAEQAAVERQGAARAICFTIRGWQEFQACLDAAHAAFVSALQAAQMPLHAPNNALAAAIREATRLQRIDGLVRAGVDPLNQMLHRAAEDRRAEYYHAVWPRHRNEFDLAAQYAAEKLAAIADPWELDGFTHDANSVEEVIRYTVERYGNPVEQRDAWLERARHVRARGEATRAAIPKYRKALEAVRNVANPAQTELLAFVERYGPLMSHFRGLVGHTQASIDAFIQRERSWISWTFRIKEAERVALAEHFDYEGTAGRIEAGLAQVDHWVQQLDIFYFRLRNLQPQMKQLSQAITQYRTLASPEPGGLNKVLAMIPDAEIDKLLAMIPDDSRLHAAYQALPDFLKRRGRVFSLYLRHSQEMDDILRFMSAVRAEAERRHAEEEQVVLARAVEARLQSVHQLYQDFAAAYEARNLGRLVRLMAPDWHADDGSDLRDLEDNLDNSFRVFDRKGFRVDNLNIQPLDDRYFQVSYQLTIIGQIFQMNLKHEETFSVQDLVVVEPDGTGRIKSTSGGRLWMQ